MADTKISGMAAASALTGAEVLPVVQSAANVKATTQQVVDAAMTTGLTRQALGSINTNTTIDWSAGSYATATITGALTFTFSNPAASGKACVAYLQLTNGGSATITWPVSVTWSGGTAPTLRASGVDLLRFYTQDGGTTWFGTAENDEPDTANSPGGSSGQLQYNNAGAFDGAPLWRESANEITQRNGAFAQSLLLCNNYTDPSNYEGGFIRWTSNSFGIGTQSAGTGATRNFRIYASNNASRYWSIDNNGNWTANNAGMGVAGVFTSLGTNSYFSDIYANLSGNAIGYLRGSLDGSGTLFSFSGGAHARYGAFELRAGTHTADRPTSVVSEITGKHAYSLATVNISGGVVSISGGDGASGSAGAAAGGDVRLDGGRGYGTGAHGDVVIGSTRGALRLPVLTVATLPAATAGRRCFVSDANSTTFQSVVAGGGSNFVPVFSDGANWRIG